MKPLESLEHSLRQLFERLGAKLDAMVGGSPQQIASVRTMLGSLSLTLQRAIDSNLKKDERGVSCLAPHRLRLLFDYDTYSRFSRQSLRMLQQELTTAAKQYINDRRYRLAQPLALILTYDPIASSPIVRADFGESAPVQPAVQARPVDLVYRLRSVSGPISISVDLKDLKQGGAPISIGRAGDNVVVLDDKSVSKFHASIAIDSEGRVILADCGSANGTFLNGQAIGSRSEVAPGDILGFGDVMLRWEKAE